MRLAPTRPLALNGLVAGYVVWSAAFVVLYAVHATGCEWGWPLPVLRAVLVALWATHLALAAGLTLAAWRWGARRAALGEARFLGDATLVLCATALFATLWTLFPVAVLELCM